MPMEQVQKEQLKTVVERIEKLNEDMAAIKADIKEVYKEAKGDGFDVKTLKDIIKLRKKDKDEFNNERDLISLAKNGDTWQLVANDICKIADGNGEVPSIAVTQNNFYVLNIIGNGTKTNALIYICNENDPSFTPYQVTADGEYTIGSLNTENIVINDSNIGKEQAVLIRQNGRFGIKEIDKNVGIYVNDYKETNKVLENGDIIFILGYKIIVLNDYIIINNRNNAVTINSNNIIKKELPNYNGELMKTSDDDNAELYNENDYFTRSPRFVTSIVEENISIDNPPGATEKDDTPVIYTIGPMLTMALSSVISASTSIMTVLQGRGTWTSVLPTALLSVAMLISTILNILKAKRTR